MSDHSSEYANSAVIVWDMQYGIAERALKYDEIVANIKSLIDAAHEAGNPVIYSQQTGLPYEYMTRYQTRVIQKRGIDPRKQRFMVEGTHDWEIVDRLAPQEQDIVIKKHTPSFFIGTYLDQLLRARNIDSIVVVGVRTEIGVEATARHGAYLGYLPIVVEDAVGSYDEETHEASLIVMKKMFEVKSTSEVLAILKSGA
ncbi:MAG: cysteine hydrolase [Nitrososphaerota archaeon]|nr:cysteine hydrolase [Nitrososphaerota archaeon]